MCEGKHTPTPWAIREERQGLEIEWKGRHDQYGMPTRKVICKIPFRRTGAKRGTRVNYHCTEADKANADFIVKAANSHDGLVEALQVTGILKGCAEFIKKYGDLDNDAHALAPSIIEDKIVKIKAALKVAGEADRIAKHQSDKHLSALTRSLGVAHGGTITADSKLQQQTISDLMDERDSIAKALKKYGQHNLTCNWSRLGADPCTCGLKEAFENIGAKLE